MGCWNGEDQFSKIDRSPVFVVVSMSFKDGLAKKLQPLMPLCLSNIKYC